ncbi:hypothetical protein [Haladaptatus sp. DFWS20]
MAENSAPLGTCPFCRATIPADSLLIEYDTDDGTMMYAECPGCREVVHPE